MKVLSGGRDRHVEGWRGGGREKLRRSEKAREEAQAVDQAKNEFAKSGEITTIEL
jgi:hypothetical protein